ncbi:MAG: HlyC/CorC family transporter [Spirochaetes bacterium]|nr:HlyC/CorC family transporter [Spirochaetota bacterium]
MIFYILLLILLLLLSGFFSGSETSIFYLSPENLENIKKKHPNRGQILSNLLENPQKLLVTILICNLFVNISASLVTEKIINNRIIATVIITLLLLIFGEAGPKSIAIKISKYSSLYVSPIIYFLSVILTPISFTLKSISEFFVNINSFIFYRKSNEPTKYHTDEVIHIIEESQKKGLINIEESNILGNIINFPKTELIHILRPRNEIFSLSLDTNITDVIEIIKEKKYSKIPVWVKEPDNIIGILHIKDLLNQKIQKQKISAYENIFKKPFFIPDSMKPESLLKEFQKSKNYLALVINEYGDLLGLITMEDIVEKIIGEIIDKEDVKPLYYRYDQNIIEIEAKIEISEFNKVFKTYLKSNEAATVAGYLLNKIRYIPKMGEIFVFGNLQFKITTASPNKIDKIMVTKLKKKMAK